MKYIVKFVVVTFLFLICTFALADQKIAYLDMKFVLNNSKAGKGAQDFLQKSLTENQERFIKREKELQKEEKDLLAKRPDLTKEEYQKKTNELRAEVMKYQAERRKVLDKITEQRSTARKTLLEKLDPIVRTYITENNISLVVDKQTIVAATSNEFDITNIIVETLNKEFPSLNIN